MQILAKTLGQAPAYDRVVDLTFTVSGFAVLAQAIRVVKAANNITHLLVGGINVPDSSGISEFPISEIPGSSDNEFDGPDEATYLGVLIYGSVAVGSTEFLLQGSLVLPSFSSGITALSQTSALHPGFVLASTDVGVFKCDPRVRLWRRMNACGSVFMNAFGLLYMFCMAWPDIMCRSLRGKFVCLCSVPYPTTQEQVHPTNAGNHLTTLVLSNGAFCTQIQSARLRVGHMFIAHSLTICMKPSSIHLLPGSIMHLCACSSASVVFSPVAVNMIVLCHAKLNAGCLPLQV